METRKDTFSQTHPLKRVTPVVLGWKVSPLIAGALQRHAVL
jgi:hypothetical protein